MRAFLGPEVFNGEVVIVRMPEDPGEQLRLASA
jgi:hypothetical protein